jgi:hypothetical protein
MNRHDEHGRRFAHGYKETWPTSSYVSTEAVRSDYLLAHKQSDAEGAALQAKELRARGAAVPRLRKNPSRPAPANAVFFATTKGDGHQIIVTPHDAESYDFGVYSGGDKWWDGLLDADAVRKSIALELPNQKYVVKVDKLAQSNPRRKSYPENRWVKINGLDAIRHGATLYHVEPHLGRWMVFSVPLGPDGFATTTTYAHLGTYADRKAAKRSVGPATRLSGAKSNPQLVTSLPGWRQLEVGYGRTAWLPVGNYAIIMKHVDRDGTPAYHVMVDGRFKRAWGTLKGAQKWAAEQFGAAKSNPSALVLTLTDQHGRPVQLPWRTVKDGRPGNESIALRASFYTDPNDATREWVSGSITRDGKVVATWPRPMRAGKTVANPRYASGPYVEKIKLPGWNGKTSLEHASAPRVRAAFPGADHAAAIEKAIVHANAAARAYNRTMKAAIAKHGDPHPWISGIGSESFPDATKKLLRKQLDAFNRAQDAVALHYKATGKRTPLHKSEYAHRLVKAGGYGLGSTKSNPKRNPAGYVASQLVARAGRIHSDFGTGPTRWVVSLSAPFKHDKRLNWGVEGQGDTDDQAIQRLRADAMNHGYDLPPAALLLVRRAVMHAVTSGKGHGEVRAGPAAKRNPTPFYGAPMGYGSRSEAPDTTTTLLVRRVKLDSGGYASDGAYFGIGRPVYVVTNADTGSVVESLRAADFVDAKEKMRSKYPNAKVK